MKLSLATGDADKQTGDLLVLPLFDSDLADEKKQPRALTRVDKALKKLLLGAAASEGFKGKAEQSFVFHTHGKLKFDRVLLLGLGSRTKFEPEILRLAAGRAVKTAARVRAKNVVFYLPV